MLYFKSHVLHLIDVQSTSDYMLCLPACISLYLKLQFFQRVASIIGVEYQLTQEIKIESILRFSVLSASPSLFSLHASRFGSKCRTLASDQQIHKPRILIFRYLKLKS